MLSQTRGTQAVFQMRFLNCSQSHLFWVSLHVGILIQSLLSKSCCRELLGFHLRKLSGLDNVVVGLTWCGHLQGPFQGIVLFLVTVALLYLKY